jgi:hypothetical protein
VIEVALGDAETTYAAKESSSEIPLLRIAYKSKPAGPAAGFSSGVYG